MNATTTLIDANAAIAVRLIRSGAVPRQFFRWLGDPAGRLEPPTRFANSEITKSMNSILRPLLEDASTLERRDAGTASDWYGAIGVFVADRYKAKGMGFAMRLYASSLLPVYRVLATGRLREGFEQSRERLAESLAVLGMSDELGPELLDLLELSFRTKGTPGTFLRAELGLDLRRIGKYAVQFSSEFNESDSDFSSAVSEEIQSIDPEASLPVTPEWAQADLLWRLSGELISKKSEMVLPRAWVDTPVPWSNISDHWHALEHALANLQLSAFSDEPSVAKPSHEDCNSTRQCSSSANPEHEVPIDAPPLFADDSTETTSKGRIEEATPKSLSFALGAGPALESLDEQFDAVDALFADEDEKLTGEPLGAQVSSDSSALEIPSKIIIAEIKNHNDPAFVNVLRRQIGTCRSEDRTVCLSNILVLPEDDAHRSEVCGARENGLTLWQQKLVNWLADHPDVVDPYAFLTDDGNLILSVLDLERNEMTTLLRQGLVEVLSGKSFVDMDETDLTRVQVPARYHVGISSTSSPGASFSPEQLIEPSLRCLLAAERHGKASIKSIEVF